MLFSFVCKEWRVQYFDWYSDMLLFGNGSFWNGGYLVLPNDASCCVALDSTITILRQQWIQSCFSAFCCKLFKHSDLSLRNFNYVLTEDWTVTEPSKTRLSYSSFAVSKEMANLHKVVYHQTETSFKFFPLNYLWGVLIVYALVQLKTMACVPCFLRANQS